MKRIVPFMLALMMIAGGGVALGRTEKAYAAEAAKYVIEDAFGAAPNIRSLDTNMERVKLSDTHKPFTKYGYGAHLTSSATAREYITYDVPDVSEIEVSAIAVQSIFGANHGWGVSLGVTDNAASMPLNNINRIDLKSIYPMYLSTEGRPFLYYPKEKEWFCYIAGGEKFSFAPSSANPGQKLRPFTVPDEVGGVYGEATDEDGDPLLDEDGNPIIQLLQEGELYPMINVEYYADGKWTPLALNANRFKITEAQYIGGDKEYNQTVKITGIPTCEKVRIGMDYIRETLKPSAAGDIAGDVFEPFAKQVTDSIFVHDVKLTVPTKYEGGYEDTMQTGIAADTANVRREFGFGEAVDTTGIAILKKLNDEFTEKTDDEFTVDTSKFDPYTTGIYQIKLTSGAFTAGYYVEVVEPTGFDLITDGVVTSFAAGSAFNSDGLKVVAITTIGSGSNKKTVKKEVPAEKVKIDISSVDLKKAGEYTVKVSAAGTNTVPAEYTVTVTGKTGGCGSSLSGGIFGIFGALGVIGAALGVLLIRKKRHA